ncbi:MAG TPA: bifunctional phosphopantothenoylcysteine decarboxylase/phosphopantothenate--cysteine ligase CoaBC, partial [Phaeodactylibacter sp.]|nr:bifunctional phosphopantothenoylcysteine decarboxylase/phosphopantothenate--cysteine ligase CoaBC [Phaeodactylibacter sp.]
TLSKNIVFTQVSSHDSWNNHVEMGLWADAMLVAPATATTLAKMANGICDSIIVATYLSAKCPVFFAPAMDLDMWKHPATQQNIQRLRSYDNQLIPVGHGELASGLLGDGRMAEPEDIASILNDFFKKKHSLNGHKALVTAGPTYEAIDPVRFIGNHSSGKMGIAIAEELAARGAEVSLVLGPSKESIQNPGIKVLPVQSAQQMYDTSVKIFPKTDIAVLAAAVADYRPKVVATQKIKKSDEIFSLQLERTNDIAETLGKIKTDKQILVGFALETNNELQNAIAKRKKKNFDFIVLNSLQDKGAGFQHNTNKISIVAYDDSVKVYDLKPKKEVAKDIVEHILQHLKKN